MDTLQLTSALADNLWQPQQYEVLPIDKLENYKISQYPCSIIINLDPSSQPGSHWVAIYIDECVLSDCSAEYFCSFASDIPPEIQSFFCEKCGYNGIVAATILPFQNPESLSCGLWALDFILHKSWGLTTAKYIARFHGNDYLANEKVLASRWGGDISALRFKFNDLAV